MDLLEESWDSSIKSVCLLSQLGRWIDRTEPQHNDHSHVVGGFDLLAPLFASFSLLG